ncbi:unnamed protein product [Fusarium fujikuroi]|nr:unnamed protein product [Fusarium fujikuroi]VTT71676.1 unnamed protein product [Fusarium fujikuroi]VZI21665.1 unnamed protein product [Fusarium fujikuroi]
MLPVPLPPIRVQQNLAANQTPTWNETLTSTPSPRHLRPQPPSKRFLLSNDFISQQLSSFSDPSIHLLKRYCPIDICLSSDKQPSRWLANFGTCLRASLPPSSSSSLCIIGSFRHRLATRKAIGIPRLLGQSSTSSMPSTSPRDAQTSIPFFGAMGCTCAIVFTCLGASYGTAKSGVGIAAMGVLRPDLIVKNIVPVIMAGIIGIYGLVVSVLISDGLKQDLPLFTSFIQFGAGLSVGLAGLAAGFAIGIVGDAGVRGTAQQPRLFVGMILILIFAEVLGLYGLIVALLMNSKANVDAVC